MPTVLTTRPPSRSLLCRSPRFASEHRPVDGELAQDGAGISNLFRRQPATPAIALRGGNPANLVAVSGCVALPEEALDFLGPPQPQLVTETPESPDRLHAQRLVRDLPPLRVEGGLGLEDRRERADPPGDEPEADGLGGRKRGAADLRERRPDPC